MLSAKTKVNQRLEYAPYPYRLSTVSLAFHLAHAQTEVTLDLTFEVLDVNSPMPPLVLDGEALMLVAIVLNGKTLASDAYRVDDEKLVIFEPPATGRLRIVTVIHPRTNTSLLGLFSAEEDLFTQCEAEGFRKITYFADRPDVLAVYTVKLIADRTLFPVLLSNGNLLEQGQLANNLHYANWHDPFAKPSYLFALVVGSFTCIEAHFKQNNQQKLLQFYVKPQDVSKAQFALKSLKDAIDWDFQQFNLALDLERFMVVATSTFNAGAMENKGLNIFNTKYILADEHTATDEDFADVEAIVGHEYFHNWTGNRVTCRSWFELSLKEGLTVYREQAFSAHQLAVSCKTPLEAASARVVKRIAVVSNLRSEQFVEDAGPIAHPVRFDSYQEISNFYTATTYDKGAEVVGMYHTLFGDDGFKRGLALYLAQHDGQAVTCDDFRMAMAKANNADLSQFELWYSQAGTPRVSAYGSYDASQQTYTLTLQQNCANPNVVAVKQPFLIPLNIGLIATKESQSCVKGQDLPLYLRDKNLKASINGASRLTLQLTQAEQTFVFEQVLCEPLPSLNRHFGAPIILDYAYSDDELCFLLAHDSDAFNRWNSAQKLWLRLILVQMLSGKKILRSKQKLVNTTLINVLKNVLSNPQLSEAFRANLFTFPDFDEAFQFVKASQTQGVDPQALYLALEEVQDQIAVALAPNWQTIYAQCQQQADCTYNAKNAGVRALKNLSLLYLTRANWREDIENATTLAQAQFDQAENMTDRLAAFELVIEENTPAAKLTIENFYKRFAHEPLVVDKWFASLVTRTALNHMQTIVALRKLLKHPAYANPIPNRIDALVFSFCYGNPHHFHQRNSAGYRFWADQVIQLDKTDPQTAASLARALAHWQDYAQPYRKLMLEAILEVQNQSSLSKELNEIVINILNE